MYEHSEEERAALAAESAKKTGCSEIFEAIFVPDGADDDEGIAVIFRRFTPAEFGAWIDRPSSATDTANTAMDLVLSLDGATGAAIPAAVNHLADLMDGALATINGRAARPLGFIPDAEVMSTPLGRKATPKDVERFGLPVSVLALRDVYKDPGQLRMVRAAELPPVVVRRPSREEWDRTLKAKRHVGTCGLLISCIVEPHPIEARRELVQAWPGLAHTIFSVFAEMRGRGATMEGKGGRSISPPRVT